MIYGRTHLHEFTRDDGSVVVIEHKRSPYFPGYGPSWNDPGCPPEGGDIAEWEVDGGTIILTGDEVERAEREIYALPWDPYEDRYDDC